MQLSTSEWMATSHPTCTRNAFSFLKSSDRIVLILIQLRGRHRHHDDYSKGHGETATIFEPTHALSDSIWRICRRGVATVENSVWKLLHAQTRTSFPVKFPLKFLCDDFLRQMKFGAYILRWPLCVIVANVILFNALFFLLLSFSLRIYDQQTNLWGETDEDAHRIAELTRTQWRRVLTQR